MKQKVRNLVHLLLGALLGALGFSSCDFLNIGGGKDMYGCPVVMYGQPTVQFRATGKVTDRAGKPIEGIRVAVNVHRHYANSGGVIYDKNDWYDTDTVYTDAAGKYKSDIGLTSFTGPDDATLVFEDIDGPAHGGSFAPATVTPGIKQTRKGDGLWDNGDYEATADAVLDPKD